MKYYLSTLFLLLGLATAVAQDRIDLSGQWDLCLRTDGATTIPTLFDDSIMLPGTTDVAGKGMQPSSKTETTHLTRLHSFKGKAWYRRTVEIPTSWRGHDIYLFMERTKPSTLYIDGKQLWSKSDISVPQWYEISGGLTPGRHTLVLCIDNASGVPEQIYASSHAYTEDTQTNWNGVIGSFYLQPLASAVITGYSLIPHVAQHSVTVKVYTDGAHPRNSHLTISATPRTWNGKVITRDVFNLEKRAGGYVEVTLNLGADARLWSEFSPDLYDITLNLNGVETTISFGLREFTADRHHFYINGKKTFLRGKHDACVWPLTGHVPMDTVSWNRYLKTLKSYGINHVRFHSWCPPEAAFRAADEQGIYLQPELPFWGDFNAKDSTLMSFLMTEGLNIIQQYAHHPSFVMMALGNELWGSIDMMHAFVNEFRRLDPSKLYTFGSNYYLGYQGIKPGIDYFTTCRIGGEAWDKFNTHTRGSFSFADAFDGGLLNHCPPNTMMNFDEACNAATVPIISHETGQFQSYPDYAQMQKYTGVLYPYSMEVFRKRLADAGMAAQAHDFHRASGLWAAQLYKADIEMDLRTRNMAGFQLLDLQDYPGQGSAYVGLLDAFMDNKGYVTAREWRGFCAPVVPMLEFYSYVYSTAERPYEGADCTWSAHAAIANYSGQSLRGKTLRWQLLLPDGSVHSEGQLPIATDSLGLFRIGSIEDGICDILRPTQLRVQLQIEGTEYANSYPMWVYPNSEKSLDQLKKGILVTHKMTEDIGRKLQRGARVLLMPDSAAVAGNTVAGLFQTDYWNYRMFKTICENNKKRVSPGTLGLLMNPAHALFRDFPTDSCTSWQWFPIVKASRPLILDRLSRDYRPLVQVIDNVERNHKLGLIFEFSVGKGRLLVCMADLDSIACTPEGEQFYRSLLGYMQSKDFAPQTHIGWSELVQTLTSSAQERRLKELNNISQY
uniref:Beta-glucuronidase n=1 Tax=Prevotella sp. GTC17253 TaxID=3236793 RepID=A0AB33J0Y5_9BACT